ncbi:MAG: hypothetical protein WCY86_10955, partial [Spirosomataceae bacterium]
MKIIRLSKLTNFLSILPLLFICHLLIGQNRPKEQGDKKWLDNTKMDGYRGIWWFHPPMQDRKQSPSYGSKNYKYSGPLSFAWPHTVAPMAVYAPEVNKTFFVYGGDTGPNNRYLCAMISYYDHEKHRVPKPTVVRDQRGVDDPHDNPSLTID